MSERIFTLDEAQRAIPLVKRIAADLNHVVESLIAIPGGVSYVYGESAAEDIPDDQRKQALDLRNQLEDLTDELSEIGVHLKGLQPVLVDFPAVRDGEDIFLCWAYGEDSVEHWHTPESGFRGRQKLT